MLRISYGVVSSLNRLLEGFDLRLAVGVNNVGTLQLLVVVGETKFFTFPPEV